jgi:hypothetical protein
MVSFGGLDWDGSTGSGALTERKPDGLSADIKVRYQNPVSLKDI